MKNKEVFSSLDSNNNKVELAMKRPTPNQLRLAQEVSNQKFYSLIHSDKKTILRRELEADLRNRGLWGDDQQAEYDRLTKALADGEIALQKGGIGLSQAKEIAIQMMRDRGDLQALVAERRELDSMTVEGQCDNERFSYLVYCCLVYNDTGAPYYSSFDEYHEKASEIAAIQGATILMTMLYGVDADIKASLPETQFLKKYKFVDDKYRFINKDGKLTDYEGRLINEDGRYITEDGQLCDIEGRPVDKEGNLIIDFSPFLDDSGNPVNVDAEVKETPKKGRPKKVTS